LKPLGAGVGRKRRPAKYNLVHPAREELVVLATLPCPLERTDKRLRCLPVAEPGSERPDAERARPRHGDRSFAVLERKGQERIDRGLGTRERELILDVIRHGLERVELPLVGCIALLLELAREQGEILPATCLGHALDDLARTRDTTFTRR